MKPAKVSADNSSPAIIATARAQAVIFIIEPDRWIVAHSGMTNDASSGRTPRRSVRSSVTGIVAAEDCVPRAVT